MPRSAIPFAGGSIISDSLAINNQYSLNWIPVSGAPGAKSQISMKPTPGLKSLGFNAGVGPVRTIHGVKFKGSLYFVSRSQLLKIDPLFAGATVVGTLNSSSGFVDMVASPTELLIVDGTDGYIWDDSSFTEIADPDFPAAETCTWMNFYFIVSVAGTGQFQKSALNDGTDWDGLDFATAESVSDNLKRVYATNDNLYLIGELSTEVYFDSAHPDFNFEQRSNGVAMVGTNAPWSLSENDAEELVFIANTERGRGDVVKMKGTSFAYITDADTATRIQTVDDLSNATGWIYTQDGHSFYVLNLSTLNTTICYDFRENYWHDRQTYNKTRHIAGAYAYFEGKHVVADYESSGFYEYDNKTYDDDGATVVRIRRGVILHKDGLNITVNRLDIEFEAGVGLVTGQGSDPQAMLRYSRNGKTWSNSLWRGIGKIGEYENRSVWDALGNGRQLLFEVSVSDPVPAVLIGAYVDIEAGYV